VKVEVGDRGDNLMPGTPLRFFDLYDEDEVWGWTDDEVETLTRVMKNTTQSNRVDHLEKSAKYLRSLGMFLPEIPPPTEADVVIFSEKAVRERREALHPELRGINKKYCMSLSDPDQFTKCAKIVADDRAALDQIKELEKQKKESAEFNDSGLIKSLKQSRQDYKAMLLRFNAQAQKN
jgi:hypothetical protein